jgi:hypothetical protein
MKSCAAPEMVNAAAKTTPIVIRIMTASTWVLNGLCVAADRGSRYPITGIAGCCARREWPHDRRAAEQRDELAPFHSITSSARPSGVVGTLRPMPLPGSRLILEDQTEQEMHVAAVGSAFRRLGSIGSPHLAQVPYVPSDIRFRAASI